MDSQQASSRFLKTTTEGELMTQGCNLFHGSTIRTEKQPFDEPNEKSGDATSGRDHEGENKAVESRINHAEGNICRGKFHSFNGRLQSLDHPYAFIRLVCNFT